jgi:hypothetical protein
MAALAIACGEPGTEPIPFVQYESQHFVLLDYAETPASLADSLLQRLEFDYTKVVEFLPTFEAPASIVANILPGWGLPFMTRGDGELNQWANNLVFDYNVHLLIHILTDYTKSEFFEEALAVYGTEVLVPDSRTVEPYRGQVPHAWMALFAEHQTVIPLATLYEAENVVYDPEGSYVDASAWAFFIHSGSFARWIFDEYGSETWWRLYDGEVLDSVLDLRTEDVERRWVATASGLYPNPLPCREALATGGYREEFWCALAEGEVGTGLSSAVGPVPHLAIAKLRH